MTLLDEPKLHDDARTQATYRYEWMVCLIVAVLIVAGVTTAMLLMVGTS